MSLCDFDPAARMEAQLLYLGMGYDLRLLGPLSHAWQKEIKESREVALEAFMTLNMEPLVTKPARVMPQLDLPKPKYLHTITLVNSEINKAHGVGFTTYKVAKP